MTFLPNLPVLAAFTLAAVVLVLTPGADMALYLGQTLAAGRRRGFAAMLGITTGVLIHSLLAAFGLSALLAASAPAFLAIKIAGITYLLWLAVQAIRRGSALALGADPTQRRLGRVFLMGLTVNLLNPKVIVFFLTFLPQFVSTTDPHASAKLFFLGCYFIGLALPICALLILGVGKFTASIRRSPRVRRVFDFLFAGLMGAFALRLLSSRAD